MLGLGLAALLYLAFTLLCLRPGWGDLSSAIAPDLGDPLFNLSILKWGAGQWAAGLPDYWSAPFFFPLERTITLSDHLLGPSAFVALFTALVPNAVAAYNFLFLSSFVLSGLATFWVLRQCGLGRAAAFAGGLIFAFSPFRMDQRSHLQILLAQWVPLVLWFWDRLLAERTGKKAVLFLLFYALHLSGGNYLAYMIHLPMAAILAVRARELRSELFSRRSLAVLAPVALGCILLLAAVFYPYTVPTGLDLERGMSEWRHWGASAVSYFMPGISNWYFGDTLWSLQRPENTLFAGFLPTLLAVMGLAGLWRERERQSAVPLSSRRRLLLAVLLTVAALAWLLGELHTLRNLERLTLFRASVGLHGYRRPALLLGVALLAWLGLSRRWTGRWPAWTLSRGGWERGLLAAGGISFLFSFPIVFVPMAEVLPGLDRMRVPARFYVFVSLAVAWLAALALDRLARRWPGRHGAVVTGLLLVAIGGELVPRAMAWNPVPDEAGLEPVYQWLGRQPDVTAVLELPAGEVLPDISYMYRQTFHHKPLINGYSGFIPPTYYALLGRCCFPIPDDETLEVLRSLGVSHVIIHPPERWGRAKRQQVADFGSRPGVTQVFEGGARPLPVVAFRITPDRGAEAPP